MNLVKLTAVERIRHDWKIGDCTMGLKWDIDTEYKFDGGTLNSDDKWSVQYFGFACNSSIEVGAYYIIDLEHTNISDINKENDFSGFMELYEKTLCEYKKEKRIEKIDIIIE